MDCTMGCASRLFVVGKIAEAVLAGSLNQGSLLKLPWSSWLTANAGQISHIRFSTVTRYHALTV